MSKQYYLQAQVELVAGGDKKDGSAKLPRVELTAYTGSQMILSFVGPFIADVEGITWRSARMPLLLSHSGLRIAGHTESIRREGYTLKASGVLSGDSSVVRLLTETAERGFPWAASVGLYEVEQERLREGQEEQVNGQLVSGPITIARKSMMREISITPLGADPHATTKIAASLLGDFEEQPLAQDRTAYVHNHPFMTESRALKASDRCTLTAAMRRVARLKPELHRDFIAGSTSVPSKGRSVRNEREAYVHEVGLKQQAHPFMLESRALQETDGGTLTEAMKRVAKEKPELHQEFRCVC